MGEESLKVHLWSRLTFAARLTLGAALVLAASAAILLVTVTVRDALSLSGELDRQLQMDISSTLPAISSAVVAGNGPAVREILATRSGQANVRQLVWRGMDGTVVEVPGDGTPFIAPDWFVSGIGVAEPIASRVLMTNGRNYGTLMVSMSTTAGVNRLWTGFLSHLNLLALAVGLEFLGIVLILRSGLRPLDALIAGAQRLGSGDLTARIAPSGGPEMRQTIAAFNGMAESLGNTLTELRRSHEELRIAATAFESEEGMIVTDTEQEILRVNRAFVATSRSARKPRSRSATWPSSIR